MSRVHVGSGVHLYAEDLGSGPPVVFIAGFGMDHRVWDRQVHALAPSHRVLCIDQRGHGGSDKPLDGYEIEQLSEDLVAALGELQVGACALVGWSFGGQVAFRVAAKAPELVERLVLVGSNGVRASRSADFPFGREPEAMQPALVAHELADRIGARRATIASGFAAAPENHLLDWLVSRSMQLPTWAAVACYHSMLHADLVGDIGRVTQPVLQLIGANDPVHSAKGARWLAERLPDSRLVEIPDCGHYPMFEAPELFTAELTAFVG